jgi:hypothetical protein
MVNLSTLLRDAGTALAPVLDGGAASAGALARGADLPLLGSLLGPDDTGAVPTGASEVSRADAFTYAALAGVPRLAEALGPQATGVVVGDDAFAVAGTYEDAATGFRAVQLRSFTDGRTVFSVDGTNFGSVADVVADLDLARPQASSPAFAAMVADARTAAVVEGREVVFTGASLGGALVQVGGYEAAEAISAASPGYAGRVTVFGVDPLGGRDAAEALNGGRLDPAVLDRMNALHVRTEGDVVTRVGSHLACKIHEDGRGLRRRRPGSRSGCEGTHYRFRLGSQLSDADRGAWGCGSEGSAGACAPVFN